MTVAETPPADSPSHPSAAAPNIPRHSNEHSVDESILSRGVTPTTATEQANTNEITLTSRRSSRPTRLPSHLRDYEVNHSKLLAPGSSSSVMSGTRHPISRNNNEKSRRGGPKTHPLKTIYQLPEQRNIEQSTTQPHKVIHQSMI
ncbi:hypothetical protein LWI29_034899 [Acer saccharum]|uniref:Uncharacterized protein n=1 Tax=Acer saccharum TaxID=4024 RepID=A0AA39TMM5_ACESA|nr:hypothetical protein LWI29_034899 [Acer saccharum]